jgi:cytochrome c-type biogenesis protein CcmH/NrfG
MSGQNRAQGIERLKQCLTLEPPTPASPTHSNVWNRIGNLEEQRAHLAEARAAYAAALKLDPSNKAAQDALAKLPATPPAAK